MTLKTLHVLDHYLSVTDGYSVRSQNIIRSQQRLRFEPAVVTSSLPREEILADDGIYENVPVKRSAPRKGLARRILLERWPLLREWLVVQRLEKAIEEVVRQRVPDVIHSHSPVLCGLAASRVARRHKIPFVYEIRAFWEDAAVDQGKIKYTSPRYKATRALETSVARKADAVIGISEYILTDLKDRGIEGTKLFHVPNGVDCEKFQPQPKDDELLQKYNPKGDVLFGFIGSFYYFEGVAWMVKAFAKLRETRKNFKVLLIGDGEDMQPTRDAIATFNASEYVSAIGRVPHDQVQKYYSILDVLTYPRISIRLTELVTALKPLEALAKEKAVLASGVGAMRELVKENSTGLLFKPGDVDDFCSKAARMIDDPALREKLGKQGRKTMLEEKDWAQIGKRYREIYARAGAKL